VHWGALATFCDKALVVCCCCQLLTFTIRDYCTTRFGIQTDVAVSCGVGEDLLRLWLTEDMCDCVLHVNGHHIKAHRYKHLLCVVWNDSPMLKRQMSCMGSFVRLISKHLLPPHRQSGTVFCLLLWPLSKGEVFTFLFKIEYIVSFTLSRRNSWANQVVVWLILFSKRLYSPCRHLQKMCFD